MLCIGKEIGMREVIYNFSFEKYQKVPRLLEKNEIMDIYKKL